MQEGCALQPKRTFNLDTDCMDFINAKKNVSVKSMLKLKLLRDRK